MPNKTIMTVEIKKTRMIIKIETFFLCLSVHYAQKMCLCNSFSVILFDFWSVQYSFLFSMYSFNAPLFLLITRTKQKRNWNGILFSFLSIMERENVVFIFKGSLFRFFLFLFVKTIIAQTKYAVVVSISIHYFLPSLFARFSYHRSPISSTYHK